ncbi:MAG: hypothetical protein M1812_006960 [Candelaria pacifica]|nr:MAG: hypothetical protein M1812_006960 [Candelaria pacifica]
MLTASLLTDNIPLVQTRQALLVIDLQNDFLSMHSKLPVSSESGFVENIKTLAPVFRQTGDIIWIRTEFEEERPINDGQGLADTVITDQDIPRTNAESGSKAEGDPHQTTDSRHQSDPARPSKRAMELLRRISARNLSTSDDPDSEEDEDNETFLSRSQSGRAPICCKADTLGSRCVDEMLPTMDYEKDTMVVKSYYSAFKSDSLLFTLRGKLVTELYICGSLSNISVYATALDAARHGFSITILEDCLGYRDHARHQEAMRQMADMMGADGLTSTEFIQDFKREQQRKLRREERSKGYSKGRSSRRTNPKKCERIRQSPPDLSRNAHATEPIPTFNHGSSPNEEDSPAATRTMELYGRDQPNATLKRTLQDVPSQNKEKVSKMVSTVEVDTASDEESQLLETTLKSTRTRRQVSTRRHASIPSSANTKANKSKPHQSNPVIMNDIPVLRSRPIPGTNLNETLNVPPPRAPTPTLNVLDAVSASLETAAVSDVSDQSKPVSNETISLPTANNYPTAERSFVKKEKRIKRAAVGGIASKLGPSDKIGEGDSRIVEDFLPSSLADSVFERVKMEVQWNTMSHKGGEVPRLVAVEGEVDGDGSVPIYRHPADESPPLLPFSPAISAIRDEVQKVLDHPVNHVLIQLYRDGRDNISEHSDKTLDIVHGSNIVNVSLGAQRTMTLRTKKSAQTQGSPPSDQRQQRPSTNRNPSNEGKSPTPQHLHPSKPKTDRQSQRISLPHNSIFILGQQTNKRWLHAIRADKRLTSEKSEQEIAFNGERISLTFRKIGTFFNETSQTIWGQGAHNKEKASASKVIKSKSEANKCLQAFGKENQSSDFSWSEEYNIGFNILDMNPTQPKLILNGDLIAASQVKFCLSEMGISYDEEQFETQTPSSSQEIPTAKIITTTNTENQSFSSPTSKSNQNNVSSRTATQIKYIDNDAENSVIEGAIPILLYLDKFNSFLPNPSSTPPAPPLTPPTTQSQPPRSETAQILTRLFQTSNLLDIYLNLRTQQSVQKQPTTTTSPFTNTRTSTSKNFFIESLKTQLKLFNTYLQKANYLATDTDISIADCAFWPVLRGVLGEDWFGIERGDGDEREEEEKKGDGNKGDRDGEEEEFEALRNYFRRVEMRGEERKRK